MESRQEEKMAAPKFRYAQRGSILVFVLVFAIVVGAAAASLVAESTAGLKLRKEENTRFRTVTDCVNGLDMARNAIETSSYNDDGHNLALWNIDSSADGNPGANPLIDNGRVTVTASYLGNFWYELDSISTSADGLTKEIKQRVREKDFFSRYALFIENGDVRIADTTSYYGPVHGHTNGIFHDSLSGVGARVYGFMTSTAKFTFNGNAEAETQFYMGFADDLGKDGWIDLPDPKLLADYKDDTGAYGGSGQVLWSEGAGGNLKELRRGPGGFSVNGNVYTYIELIYDIATSTQYVKFTIKNTSGTTLYTSSLTADYEMLPETIIHVEQSIKGIKGEMHDAATIVSETEDILISADIYYVDDEGDHPRIFDPDNPENENYLVNPDYNGNAVLGLIAHADILYTGAEDDKNLEVNGAIMAITGQVKWGGLGDKDHLRVFGARISNGQTYRCSGWSGYNNSGVYTYDDDLRVTPPPKFLPLEKPLFIGFQVIR
jgi:hypothetical protein